jgi:hypothetical protein
LYGIVLNWFKGFGSDAFWQMASRRSLDILKDDWGCKAGEQLNAAKNGSSQG